MAKRQTQEQFIERSNATHDSKYNYSLVQYTGSKTHVIIVCPIHGEFKQTPLRHVKGFGCEACSYSSRKKTNKKNTQQFIQQATCQHASKYDYSEVQYSSAFDKVTIKCPIHGRFKQTASEHTKGRGCPKCGRLNTTQYSKARNIIARDKFIDISKAINGNKFTYTNTNYIDSKTKVTITCRSHGDFKQRPGDHTTKKAGCPKCANEFNTNRLRQMQPITVSAGEQQVCDFITSLGVTTIQSDRSIICPLELDIYIPSRKLAIEYCGVYWHSEQNGKTRNYHANKHNLCYQQNIQLITIFEDEWLDKQQQVKNKLKHLLNKCTSDKIYARHCDIIPLLSEQKRDFFNQHHIQGDGPSSINIALQYNGTTIAAVGFARKHVNQYYLNRFATSDHVIGGFTKLVTHFQRNYNWSQIISFADLRWSNGNLYNKNGWCLDTIIPPDYSYSSDGRTREHKFNYRRKNLVNKLNHFDPGQSEWINCKNNNILRIWDCGKQRWVLNNTVGS